MPGNREVKPPPVTYPPDPYPLEMDPFNGPLGVLGVVQIEGRVKEEEDVCAWLEPVGWTGDLTKLWLPACGEQVVDALLNDGQGDLIKLWLPACGERDVNTWLDDGLGDPLPLK